jgi:hypothetical protein
MQSQVRRARCCVFRDQVHQRGQRRGWQEEALGNFRNAIGQTKGQQTGIRVACLRTGNSCEIAKEYLLTRFDQQFPATVIYRRPHGATVAVSSAAREVRCHATRDKTHRRRVMIRLIAATSATVSATRMMQGLARHNIEQNIQGR